MSGFSFNFANAGKPFARVTSMPRLPQDGYPLDLDGSLDYLRPARGWTLWPDPATYPAGDGIGCVSGLMPQMDAAVYAQMIARLSWGPGTNSVPENPTQYTIQSIFPSLPQIGGEAGAVAP